MKVGAADPRCAFLQHREFVQKLRELGASIKSVDFVHGAYDSVFVKDSAVAIRRGAQVSALLAQPRYEQRQIEQSARARALAGLGWSIRSAPCTALEGGDIVLRPDASGAFLGTGFRSDARSALALTHFLDAPVTALELVDPRLYHLDMVLAMVAHDTVLVCEDALSARSRAIVRAHFAPEAIVPVTLDEALAFGVNVVPIGRDLVVASRLPRLHAVLGERGYRVHVVDLSEFHLAGGSAACLVSIVKTQERVAVSTTAAMRSTAA